MLKREIISSIMFAVALFDIIGLTGSADCGYIGFNEYVPAAVINLVIMVASLLIGSDKLEEFTEKKKAAAERTLNKQHTVKYHSVIIAQKEREVK